MLESKVSIIVATFNAGKTLRRALESVINQKNDNWECIIVDGMSSDDTLSIVKEFEEKDKRFRHINSLSQMRNSALITVKSRFGCGSV